LFNKIAKWQNRIETEPKLRLNKTIPKQNRTSKAKQNQTGGGGVIELKQIHHNHYHH